MRRLLTALVTLAVASVMFAVPASADGHIRIHLLHGIPGIDVDVAVGGDNVFEDFSFGDAQDLSSFAGGTLENLQVKVAGTDDVAIDAGDVPLPSEGNFTVIAHLDASGTPALAVFENDDSSTAAGQGRLTVRHAAAAPAVDILANGDVVFADVTTGNGGTVDLAAGTISATVVPTGESAPVVIGPADLAIAEGAHLIVYAVGSLDGDSLTVTTESISGLATPPAAVNTGNSPVSAAAGTSTTLIAALALGALMLVAVPAAARTRG